MDQRKRIPTPEKLAQALEELDDPKLADMIELARKGYYDDYKTTIPAPTVQLVLDLRKAGYDKMAERAKDGKWEAKRWEAEEWFENEGRAYLRRNWPGGRKTGNVDTI